MFSELGQIWTQKFRETEATDTHAYIREHKRDQQKKDGNRKNQKEKSDIFDADDIASVSVPALDAFLQSILQSHGKAGKPSLSEAAKDIQTPKIPQKEAKGAMRAPVSAYQHAAETVQNNKTYEISEKQSQALNLTPEEIDQIAALVQGLQDLKNRGVQTIEISVGSSFLQSLRIAIEKAASTG